MSEISFYVYVCKSLKDGRFYVGSTNNLERRLHEHVRGEVVSTTHRQPLNLLYYKVYKVEKDARIREKYLKGGGRTRKNLKLQLTETLSEPD
jgi:putative endonuclease